QVQTARLIQTELKLGVGNDDAPLRRVGGRFLVNLQGHLANLLGQLLTNFSHYVRKAYVLVVRPDLSFRSRRKNRLRQALSQFQASGQGNAAYRTRFLIVFPTRTDQI